jgi:hypothetical protein
MRQFAFQLRQLGLTTLLALGVPGCYGFLPLAAAQASPLSPAADKIAVPPIEAQTLKQATAQRLPGEADSTFLRRVLPASYPQSNDLLAATWRPSAFGKQLFFTVRGTDESNNDGGTDLFMLDPFQANTYAVQVFTIPSQGDLTDLEAFFFTDVDQDGHKELLAISECSLRESFKDHGEVLYGRAPHYQTVVFQYVGLSSTGRPQYRDYPKDTSYLDELPTAAAVRQALARHQQRSKTPRQPAVKAVKK